MHTIVTVLLSLIVLYFLYIFYIYYNMTQQMKKREMGGNKNLKVSKSPSLPETGPITNKSVKIAASAAETTNQTPVIKPPSSSTKKTPVAKPPKKPNAGDKLATFGKDLGGAIVGQAIAKNNANRLF